MPAYNTTEFDPPAPIALVSFVNPDTGQRIDNIQMLVDSGADATVVPEEVVGALNATIRGAPYQVEFLASDSATLSSVHLEMKWLGHNFTGEFLVARNPHGLIGRNVLNHVRIVLDGPALRWEEG